MPVILFGKTVDRFLARNKTVTRRDWKIKTFNTFVKAYHNKTLIDALNKSYRNGGEKIEIIRLVQEPYWEVLIRYEIIKFL